VVSPATGDGRPLVSIGVPTHERVATLSRALDSALAQTHAELEVVISDNASSDGTEALCRAAAGRDPRVRYLRHEYDVGPTANFNTLFTACRGDYVMMLADDDWLDPGYVAACLAELRAHPSAALASGWARYERDGAFVHDGVVHDHRQADPRARVRAYLSTVDDNGVFYGLVPRAVLERARPKPNVLGNDWLHVARVACQGEIRTLPGVRIHRALGGTSANAASILSAFGRSSWQARVPQLVIAWELLRDIAWGHPVYASLGHGRRLVLGLTGATVSIRWPDLAWHLLTPSVAGLARRRRGRPVWALYEYLTRALGAGQRP
jgi:glycosyltransferase involved in cell wall biosynthesis